MCVKDAVIRWSVYISAEYYHGNRAEDVDPVHPIPITSQPTCGFIFKPSSTGLPQLVPVQPPPYLQNETGNTNLGYQTEKSASGHMVNELPPSYAESAYGSPPAYSEPTNPETKI